MSDANKNNTNFEQSQELIKHLLKVNEAIIDDTGITTIFNSQFFKSVLGLQKHFVSPSIDNPHKLKRLNIKVFDFAKLVQFSRNCCRYNSFVLWEWEQYISFILHLKKQQYESKSKQEKVPLICEENGDLIAFTSDNPIYFQPSEDDKALLTFDDFTFIYPTLNDVSNKNPGLRNCLVALEVKEFKPIEIIQERIRNGQSEPKQNNGNDYINHLRFIFKYRSQLTEGEYQRLSNLKFLHKTANKYYTSEASNCYLSNYYQPNYSLEAVA